MAERNDDTVLVTGATGFVALHTIELLQREGYRVRGTVRSLRNEAKLKHLRNLCPDGRHPIQLVEADLLRDDGWDEALRGCKYCIHVASPFPNAPPRREEDVIAPAVDGTCRVLKACARSGTVERIVLTSSTGAVHGEVQNEEGRVYTEDDWTDLLCDLQPYCRAKTLAERAAWDFVQSLPPDKKIELATVNPGYILGPTISGEVGTSLQFIRRLMNFTALLVPRMYLSFCDVRDVAVAHLRAMVLPEAAHNRHIIVSHHMWYSDMAEILKAEFGPRGYFISTWTAPNIIFYLASFVDGIVQLLLPRLDQTYTFSNRRMKEVLKINPRSAEECLVDSAHALIECGVIRKTQAYKSRN